ncbi:MAG: response regulator [Verrucomicrobia bacterium]|nr:response regulator [Verrucomicrobiota bacterium]
MPNSPAAAPRRILVVEDEALIALDLEHRLTSLGYVVVDIATTAESALQRARELRPDLVLSDIMLRGTVDGTEAATAIASELSIPVVFLTGHSDPRTVQRAKDAEPFGYLVKPFKDNELTVALEVALLRHSLEARIRRAERFLAAILASLPDAVVTTDAEGRVRYLNELACQFAGLPAGAGLGQSLAELLPLESPDSWSELANRPASPEQDLGLRPPTGPRRSIEVGTAPLDSTVEGGGGRVWVIRDISERRRLEAERQRLIAELRATLDKVDTLRGLLPICGWCKNIRNDQGYWQNVESYLQAHSQAEFTHGICPACVQRQLAQLES